MKNPCQQLPCRRSRGFSLLELLTVLAVVGVMAGLALPALTLKDESKSAAAKRMGQELSALATAASIAGADVVVDGDLNATVSRLVQGIAPADGPFKDRIFKLSGGEESLIEEAKRYLRVSDGMLLFNRNI
jgi:prepilin-type N-terminal cleavage/methylation domain-containing protein